MSRHFFSTTLLCVGLASCGACRPELPMEHPVPVSLDIVFTQDMLIDPAEDIIVERDVAYLTSRQRETVYAYDLELRQLLWSCPDPFFGGNEIPYVMNHSPVLTPDSVFVFMQGAPCMARIDRNTGERLGAYLFDGMDDCISKSMQRIYREGMVSLVVHDYALIQMDPAAAYPNPSKPDFYRQPFSSVPRIESYHTGSLVCELYQDSFILSPYNTQYTALEYRGDIYRMDYTSKEIEWRIDDRFSVFRPLLYGGKFYGTTIQNYLNKPNFDVIDLETGAVLTSIPGLSSCWCVPVASGDRVFIISQASTTTDVQGIDSIYCLSASTDEILWSRPVEDGMDFGIQPQENNGILYVPSWDSIKLFNAATGEYLGYDTSIHGNTEFFGNTVKYGNLLLLSDGTRFFGIKMNFELGANGLEKIDG